MRKEKVERSGNLSITLNNWLSVPSTKYDPLLCYLISSSYLAASFPSLSLGSWHPTPKLTMYSTSRALRGLFVTKWSDSGTMIKVK